MILPVISIQQPSYTPQDYLKVNNVNRTITINEYGQVILNDTFTVLNNGTTSTDYFIIGVPNSFHSNLFYITAKSNTTETQISEPFVINSNITGYAILFENELTPTSTINFTTTMVFGSILEPVNPGTYSVMILRCPVVYYNITTLYAEIDVPGSLTKPASSNYYEYNISDYNTTEFEIRYLYSTNPLYEYEFFDRSFLIDPWLGVKVVETHNLTLINKATTAGPSTFTVMPLEGAFNFRVFDRTGDLRYTESTENNQTIIEVNFRYSLEQDYHYIFYIEYWMPYSAFAVDSSSGPTMLFTTSPPLETVKDFTININLPPGSAFISFETPDNFQLTQKANNKIIIEGENITAYSNTSFQVSYAIGILDYIGRPLLFAGVVGVIIGVIIGVKLYEQRKEETVEEEIEEIPIPKNEINEFTRLYEDKIAVSLRLEKLEKDAAKRKVKKKEYRKQKQLFLDNIKKIENELQPLKQKISEYGPRFEDIIKNLELLDAEKENSQRSLIELRLRYRSRKITTATYVKMKEDLEKRIEKATKAIDKIILSLKQEVM